MSLGRIGTRAAVLMATATVLALGVFGVSAASAATLTVCPGGPPECGFSHLQAAVNAASSGDAIEIAAGTYNLSFPELNIEKNLTLQGAGAERTVISGQEVGVGHVVTVTITGVTIANGRVDVEKSSTLTLDHSVVRNSADIGIVNDGTLTLDNSTVSNNTTEHGVAGGILNETSGTVTLNNSMVSENKAPQTPAAPPGITGEGGGIYNASGGAVTLNNTTISKNFAGTDGGGIYNEHGGTVTLNNTIVTRNKAEEKGGGIFNNATVVGTNDTITGNTAPAGAGIFNEPPGTVNLKNSKVQSP